MRRGTMGATAFLLILLAGMPGSAAEPNYAVTDARPDRAVRTSPAAMSPALPQDLQFSTAMVTLERPEGSSAAMLRTVPVMGGVNVGVGLFSVVGATEKEMVRRRIDPEHGVRARDSRVAAVGMSLRF